MCSKRGLKWNYWRHMSSIISIVYSIFLLSDSGFLIQNTSQVTMDFLLPHFPSRFNCAGLLTILEVASW